MKFNHTQYPISNTQYRPHGQSLIELLVAISIGTILIGGSVTLMGVSLKSYAGIRKHLQANVLIRESAEVIQILARYDWHSIDDLEEAGVHRISLSGNSNTWTIISDGQKEEGTINNIPYQRYFRVYDVFRDAIGDISTSTIGTIDDPSTQKITIILEYDNNYVSSSSVSFYLTRSENNKVFHQADWSGGSGVTGPTPNPDDKYATSTNVYASEQITMATTTSDGILTSSILDTGVSDGAGFNSLLWRGNLGTGGAVKFQIAFSNCANGATNYPTCDPGIWTYYGCPTECLTSNWINSPDWSLFYSLNDDTSLIFPTIGSVSLQNKRYIRYKVNLSTSSTTPQINDIIINWSP